MKEISEELQQAYIHASIHLKGGHRRQCMARIVNDLGWGGGATWAENVLGWDLSKKFELAFHHTYS